MASKQDVLAMLEQVGAQRVPSGRDHLKYRLPNGRLFVMSHTPSCRFAYTHALGELRRELRTTHPHIASWRKNYTPPKEKRNHDRAVD